MRLILSIITAVLVLNLSACGDKAENQSVSQNTTASQAADPRYQNPLLNVTPEQFGQVLADCGKLLFGEHTPPEEVIVKCKADMKSRATTLGLTLSDENLAEPLVRERFLFSQRKDK